MLISQIRAAAPLSLCTYGSALGSADRVYAAAVGDMGRAVDDALGSWTGDAAAAASVRALDETVSGTHFRTAVLALTDTCNAVGRQLDDLRAALLAIVDVEAAVEGMTVGDDGVVTAPTMHSGNPVIDALAQEQFADTAAWLQARITGLLAQLDAVDDQGAAAITAHLLTVEAAHAAAQPVQVRDAVAAVLNGTRDLPATPALLDIFWRGLAPAEKDALFEHDPFLGNRDGIPQLDRDYYNRRNLEALQDRAHRAVDAAHQVVTATRDSGGDVDAAVRAVQEAQAYAADLDRVAANLTAPDGGPPRFLSLLDDAGHVAIAINNPDAAPNVATYVAGTGSGLGSLGADMARAQVMYTAAKGVGAPAATAVIAWLGYTAPPAIPDAADAGYAERGAPALGRFQEGLRVTHDGARSHNVVLGHSYGTTVIGEAASGDRALDADSLVFVGSPGAGVNHVTDLHLTGISRGEVAGHVFATKSELDPVPLFADAHRVAAHAVGAAGAAWAAYDMLVEGNRGGPFGVDPTDTSFGARSFTADAGPLGPFLGLNTDAHSAYWNLGADGAPTSALRNMAHLIAGTTERLT